jgi:hypothetical protein
MMIMMMAQLTAEDDDYDDDTAYSRGPGMHPSQSMRDFWWF